MSIDHKFLNKTWPNGYQTHSAILDVTPNYSPEVLFIGTYNPNTQGNHNLAEFYYGRNNYLIPLLHGIFNLNTVYNQYPPYYNILWPLCAELKLSFADLITCVLPDHDVIPNPNSNRINFNNTDFNLLKDQDLIDIHEVYTQLQWNTRQIANFINNTPTIKYVYLTQKSNNVFLSKFLDIKDLCIRNNVSFRSIHTPSGQNLPGIPKELFLCYQWLVQQDNENKQYGFNLEWLHSHNVRNFTYNEYSLNF